MNIAIVFNYIRTALYIYRQFGVCASTIENIVAPLLCKCDIAKTKWLSQQADSLTTEHARPPSLVAGEQRESPTAVWFTGIYAS